MNRILECFKIEFVFKNRKIFVLFGYLSGDFISLLNLWEPF